MHAPDPWSVSVDVSQLQNALLNLAVNARDAMQGGGKLTLETENVILEETTLSQTEEITPGAYVVIAVSDTGEGMSPDVMSKAFDPFFTTKDIGKGSGLGLSMVYGFVKQSSGYIRLYSEPGHGTTIKIYLPKAEGIASTVNKIPVEAPVVTKSQAKLVLVVEDNKSVLKLTSAMVDLATAC